MEIIRLDRIPFDNETMNNNEELILFREYLFLAVVGYDDCYVHDHKID